MRTTDIKALLNKAARSGEKAFDRARDKRITLGITGLSGSGKSTFITSLVYQLVNFHTAQLPSFSPVNQGRFMGCKINDVRQPGVLAFDYEKAIAALAHETPGWPSSTDDLSKLLLEIRYKPKSSLLNRLGPKYHNLFIELRDYPGEWLLDVPLLSQSFFDWSNESAHLFRESPRKGLLGNLRPLLDSINPVSTAEPDRIRQVHAEYVQFLQRCKDHGLSLVQPGRFLLPGKTGQPIEAFFPLVMLTGYKKETLEKSRQDSYYFVLKKAFEDYIRDQVKPFYKDFFSDIDRQVILVDVLKALNTGPAGMHDLKVSMARVLDSFHYGQNNIIRRLFSPRVSKVVLAATKIDQVLPGQHENIRALTSAIVRDVYKQASFEQVDVFTEAVSAVRCTKTVQDKEREFLLGTLDSGEFGRMWHPDIPAHVPAGEDWNAFVDWPLMKLRPPVNNGLAHGERLAHIRMDTVIRELIGDKF